MTVANWVRWNRSELDLEEREQLLGTLTPDERRRLLQDDYLWVKRVGVIWKTPVGSLRRARFTHSAAFETPRGTFRVDSEGSVRESGAERAPALALPVLIPASAGLPSRSLASPPAGPRAAPRA